MSPPYKCTFLFTKFNILVFKVLAVYPNDIYIWALTAILLLIMMNELKGCKVQMSISRLVLASDKLLRFVRSE